MQNPQWGYNLHWISAANKEMSGNFISHLLVTFMGVSYSAKVYKHSEMWNMDDRAFRIMIPLQIPRKLDPVLYVWSNSESEGEEDEVIAGLSYDYHFVQVIGGGLLHSTLP